MRNVPMMGLGVQSGSPSVTAQERLNCYLEPQKDQEKSTVVAYGTPGLELFKDFGDAPIRASLTFSTTNYSIQGGTFQRLNNAGISTQLGTLSTSNGRAAMACNGQQIILVDGSSTGYIYEIADDKEVTLAVASPGVVGWTAHGLPVNAAVKFSTTGTLPAGLVAGTVYYVETVVDVDNFNVSATPGGAQINFTVSESGTHTGQSVLTTITDADYPGLKTVAFMDGYFAGHVDGTGRYYISSQYDGMTWDALDFATAEANPDNLIAVVPTNGQLALFGEFTTELHSNTGNVDFPFSRAGAAIEWGLVSAWCVSDISGNLCFLGRNQLGQVQVCVLRGYQVQVISSPDIDRILNDYTAVDGATAYSYMQNGHPFFVLNVGSETWMYDFISTSWSQLKSHGITRHRAEIGVPFINKILVSDYSNGRVYRLSDSAYTDNGEPIQMRIRSKHLNNMRDYMTLNRVEIDFESGVGLSSGNGSNPQAMLRYSKDQGHTWSAELWSDIGKIGEYKTRAYWVAFGTAWDFVLEVTITDPVKRVITGVYGDIS